MEMPPVEPLMEKMEVVVVAVPATDVVAKYKLPPRLANTHCPTPAPAERES